MVGRVWRVAKTPVTLLALLALLLVAAKWGYDQVVAPLPPPYVAPCVQQPVADGQLRSEQVTVRILNASSKRGKAAEVSQQLKKQGFLVADVGNAEAKQEASTVIGATPEAAEVKLVQQQFKGFTTTGDNRVDHSVEVVIGQNYDGMIADAPTTIDVPGESVCLPTPAEPAAN